MAVTGGGQTDKSDKNHEKQGPERKMMCSEEWRGGE
jgi:hypothetical protein